MTYELKESDPIIDQEKVRFLSLTCEFFRRPKINKKKNQQKPNIIN